MKLAGIMALFTMFLKTGPSEHGEWDGVRYKGLPGGTRGPRGSTKDHEGAWDITRGAQGIIGEAEGRIMGDHQGA